MPPMATSDLCEAIRQLAQDAANIYFPNGSTVSVTPDFARNDLIYVSVLFKSQRGATHNGRFMISRRDIEYSKDPQRLAAEIVRNIEQMQASLARGEPRLGDPFREAVRRALKTPSQIDQKVLEDSSRISERMFLSDFRNWWDTAAVHVPFTSKVTPFIPNGA